MFRRIAGVCVVVSMLCGCSLSGSPGGDPPSPPTPASAPTAASTGAPAPIAAPATVPAAFSGPASRVFDVRQTVTLGRIPPGTGSVKLWIAIPADAPGQRVLDLQVVDSPGPWSVARDLDHGNRFLHVEVQEPKADSVSIVVDYSVRRDVYTERLDPSTAGRLTPAHRALFADDLRRDVPLMEVTEEIEKIALRTCGMEVNPVRQARLLFDYVADYADHYSKDATKPRCGRGAAEDCLAQKGGCCTDLHSLFIALARARGIPARLQMGLRLQPQNEGKDADPGYRCWVEYFVPNHGWVPTDVVAGDAGGMAERDAYAAGLDARRVWYASGRHLELSPRQTGGRVNTMIIGHAEIDGAWVPVLPAPDGTPSPLTRTVKFVERKGDPERDLATR